MEEDFEFDITTMVKKCNVCDRNILGFLYVCDDEFRCSSCFHENEDFRGDTFCRIRFPGDKRQRNTAVTGFDRENPTEIERKVSSVLVESDHDLKTWCLKKETAGKIVENCFLLNLDDVRSEKLDDDYVVTATTKSRFTLPRQNQDAPPHGFFEVIITHLDVETPNLTIGMKGFRTRGAGTHRWGWALTSDEDCCYKTGSDDHSTTMLVTGWMKDDVIGILCNFQSNCFSLYKNGIKDVRGDIFWTGRFDMAPFVESSCCKVEICFDHDLCQFKPLEFSVIPRKPVPFEIFEWKRPCVSCQCRLATHMYMCAGVDTSCQKFVVCSACFYSGNEIKCHHDKCTHWHSESVALFDEKDKDVDICIHCKQRVLQHSMRRGKHYCQNDHDETVWTFQSKKIDFGQHDKHLFYRMTIPSDVPDFDEIANSELVVRSQCKPLFGELCSSPVDPSSEFRRKLLDENFENNLSSRKKTGVVVAIDSLCEYGCNAKHLGNCVRCSRHFSFHRFGRLCPDEELSSDFGPDNDVCSRCSRSINDHHLVHLCSDDKIGHFHKNPLEQDLFIAIEDKLFVEKISQISRLVPDPGPHHHRLVSCFSPST
jgi:hypothetical protein